MTKIGEFQKNRNNENTKAAPEGTLYKNKVVNLQDQLLNQLRKNKITVSIELVSGNIIRGEITGFDSYSIILDNENKQLIYKHGIIFIKWSST